MATKVHIEKSRVQPRRSAPTTVCGRRIVSRVRMAVSGTLAEARARVERDNAESVNPNAWAVCGACERGCR